MSQVAQYEKKLQDLVSDKETLETSLYEQLLPILQSKQDKIRELQSGGKVVTKQEHVEDSYGSGTDVDEEGIEQS